MLNQDFRRILILVIALCIALPWGWVHAASQPTRIQVYYAPLQYNFDGTALAPPEGQRGFIYNNSTYVPLRFVAYSLGLAVDWHADSYTVSVDEPDADEQQQIEEYTAARRTKLTGAVMSEPLVPIQIQAYAEQVTYRFHGQVYAPPAELPGFIIENILYVPLRFFAESAGRQLEWDAKTYTVHSIEKKASGGWLDLLRGRSFGRGEAADGSDTDGSKGIDDGGNPASGNGSGNGGSGGGPIGGGGSTPSAKPTQDEVEGPYIARAEQLRDRCQVDLGLLAAKYMMTSDEDARNQLISNGLSTLSACENDFADITRSLSDELRKHDYPTDIVDEMQAYFEEQKVFGETLLCGSAGCAGL